MVSSAVEKKLVFFTNFYNIFTFSTNSLIAYLFPFLKKQPIGHFIMLVLSVVLEKCKWA